MLKQEGPRTYGALANHILDVAGDSNRSGVNATFLQLFLSYILPTKTTLSLNAETTYDWRNDQWTVPINFVVSHADQNPECRDRPDMMMMRCEHPRQPANPEHRPHTVDPDADGNQNEQQQQQPHHRRMIHSGRSMMAEPAAASRSYSDGPFAYDVVNHGPVLGCEFRF